MSDDAGRTGEDMIERRRFLKGAATVAWATPMILTMTAHQAGAQGMSCLPNGGPCDACVGMPCCDADPPDDGGCCCSDPNVPGCAGICVAVDADCTAMPSVDITDPDNDTFICFLPAPANLAGARSAARPPSSKGPKS